MTYEKQNLIDCTAFEELLTDYLDKVLDVQTHKSVAVHSLKCPICHSLLNEVKSSLAICREFAEPIMPVTRLEARILEKTIPQSTMHCDEFEGRLTDYLDGFLTAKIFHRWERHSVLCHECTDLPGTVVRSLAACVTYKLDELAVPAGLHQRILERTIGLGAATAAKQSRFDQIGEWIRSLSFPISIPQLAPVAMMMVFAFLVFSQTVSADGSLAGVYTTSYELAAETYKQGSEAWNGTTPTYQGEPVAGGTFVDHEANK